MSDPKVNIVVLPESNPCGPQSTCCGPIGQSSETIDAIKEAIEKKTGGSASVVDIETIDTEDVEYAPVVKIFNSFGAAALPIVTLDGKPVCMGAIVPEQIAVIVERELEKKAA